jgi:hypothetical protein
MNTPFDFEKLTIRELLVEILGEKDAETLLQTIQKAVKEKIHGEELNKLIHEKLCELKVTRIEVFELLHIVPQIVDRQISPRNNN